MNNAIVNETAGMPSAAAVRTRGVHSWGFSFAEPVAPTLEATAQLYFAAAIPATAPARAHRYAVPVRHRQLS